MCKEIDLCIIVVSVAELLSLMISIVVIIVIFVLHRWLWNLCVCCVLSNMTSVMNNIQTLLD